MINPELQNYIDWRVKSVIKLKDRNNYAYRVILLYADGTEHIRQYSGFTTKKEAQQARKITMGELANLERNLTVSQAVWMPEREQKGNFRLKLRPVTGYCRYLIMYLKPFWKKGKSMSGGGAVGSPFSMMTDISAVPATAGNRDQRIFTGGIIKNS